MLLRQVSIVIAIEIWFTVNLLVLVLMHICREIGHQCMVTLILIDIEPVPIERRDTAADRSWPLRGPIEFILSHDICFVLNSL